MGASGGICLCVVRVFSEATGAAGPEASEPEASEPSPSLELEVAIPDLVPPARSATGTGHKAQKRPAREMHR